MPNPKSTGKVLPSDLPEQDDSIGLILMMSSADRAPSPAFASLAEAYAWLDSHINYERRLHEVSDPESAFVLDPFRRLMERLDSPHRGIASVHIAGTRGKGSSALALEVLLTAAGLRVATFTSPHLFEYRERIRIAGLPLDPESFARCLEQAARARIADGDPPGSFRTVFEFLTAVFFLAARRHDADFLIVETGLGGRLDSTNILDPGPVLLTRIGLEHTHILGDTLDKIAGEKAAILKRGGWGVHTRQEPAALEVFRRRAACVESPLFESTGLAPCTDGAFDESGMRLRFRLPQGELRLNLPLFGPFLAENLEGVLAMFHELSARHLAPPLSGSAIAEALRGLVLPGRMQPLPLPRGTGVSLLVDGAHCPTGAAAVAAAMGAHFPDASATAVAAMMIDKDHEGFFKGLARWKGWRRIVCYALDNPRAAPAETLARAARRHFGEVRICSNLETALQLALERSEEREKIVALGSIFAVGPVTDWSRAHGRT